jgi:hypothetical protein
MEFYFGIFFAEIPKNEYIEYFAPDYTLKVPNLNMVKKHLRVCFYLLYTWCFISFTQC